MKDARDPVPHSHPGGPAERAVRFRAPVWVTLVFVLAGVIVVWLGFLILVEGISAARSTDFLVRACLVMAGGAVLLGVGVLLRTRGNA